MPSESLEQELVARACRNLLDPQSSSWGHSMHILPGMDGARETGVFHGFLGCPWGFWEGVLIGGVRKLPSPLFSIFLSGFFGGILEIQCCKSCGSA